MAKSLHLLQPILKFLWRDTRLGLRRDILSKLAQRNEFVSDEENRYKKNKL